MSRLVLALALCVSAALPVGAETFRIVESRAGFLSLVGGKSLTRTGVTLAVSPAGKISGQAFGRRVSGAWRWDGRYFCRDLTFGQRNLGPNCNLVQVRGRTVRFIEDKGAGQFADLRLE